MNKLALYRMNIFILALIILSLLQFVIPRRAFMRNRWKYMLTNLIVVFMNNMIISLVVIIPLASAEFVTQKEVGFIHMLDIDYGLSILLSVVILDVVIYWQHRIFHKVDLLWRLHRVHHVDPMLDTTSGLRFHTFEIIISNFVKVAAVFILGAPVLAVFIFEVILSTTALFNHSNFRIHWKLEKGLRIFLITPDLHLIHHSKNFEETQSNFGFSVPWWDWIFGSYKPQPVIDYAVMPLGIPKMPDEKWILFPGLLIYPFK